MGWVRFCFSLRSLGANQIMRDTFLHCLDLLFPHVTFGVISPHPYPPTPTPCVTRQRLLITVTSKITNTNCNGTFLLTLPPSPPPPCDIWLP
jgi:hypothetical protein